MIEFEKKIMLRAEEYLAIMKLACKTVSVDTQTNYYFDNDDLSMNKKGVTCRVRAKDGIFKATIKNHDFEHPECSIEVDLVEKSEFDPQVFNALGLRYQGDLITDRIVIYKDSTCEIVLDRNFYLGNTDFELEVEYCKESEGKAQKFIENIAEYLVVTGKLTAIDELIGRIGCGGSKSQRFFERLINFK